MSTPTRAKGGGMVTKVGFGWTSIIGYLSAAAAAIPIVIQAIEEGLVAFTKSGWLGVYVVVSAAITTLIRGLQASAKAHAAIKAGAAPHNVQ